MVVEEFNADVFCCDVTNDARKSFNLKIACHVPASPTIRNVTSQFLFVLYTNLFVALQSEFAFLSRRPFLLLVSLNYPLMLKSRLHITHQA